MKLVYKFTLISTICFGLFFGACQSALDIDPRLQIDAAQALDTQEGINAALNSVYARLRAVSNYGRNLLAMADALADVGQTTNNSGRLIGEVNNQPNAHLSAGGAFWQNSYFAINEVNLILEATDRIQGISDDQLNSWRGQAKFLRALYFFDLVKVHSYMPTAIVAGNVVDEGGIPIPLEGSITSDVAFTRNSSRATIDQVYDQIYADLNDAIALLGDGVGVQFASEGAAHALLSRVALYRGDWVLAANEATLALASSQGAVQAGMDYVNGWSAQINPESMFEVRFQLAAESIGVNESLQSSYTALSNLSNKNAQGGWGDFIPNATVRGFFGLTPLYIGEGAPTNNNNFWDVTRNDDVRSFLFTTGNTVRGAGRQIESIKFIGKNGFAFGDNVPVIRKSEMHLNRAEANYHRGLVVEALTELNAFKGLRGLDPVVLVGPAILEEILLERFKEFAFEGHRFFDLKRNGRDIVKPAQGITVLFDDFRILPPLPQREVDGNVNFSNQRSDLN